MSAATPGGEDAALPESAVPAALAGRFLQETIDAAPMGIIVTDDDYVVLLVNPEAERLLGRPRQVVVGTPVTDLPDRPDPMRAAAIRDRKDDIDEEVTIRTTGGSAVLRTVGRHIDAPGHPGRWLWMTSDVTDRKQAEEALAASRERFDAYLRAANDFVGVVNHDGIITSASESVERVIGYTPEMLVGLSLDRFGPLGVAFFEKVKHNSGPVTTHGEVTTLGGETRMLEVSFTDRSAEPAIGGVVVNARDITEQRAIERERHLLAEIVASSQDAIVSFDLAGTITSWNPGAERLLGWRAGAILGRSITDPAFRVDAENFDWDQFEKAFDEVKAGRSAELESPVVRRFGPRIDCSVILSPLTSNDGVTMGVSAIMRDVTDRRRAERQLEIRSRQQQAVAELGQRALEGTDIDELLQEAVAAVTATLAAGAVLVLVADDIGGGAVTRAASGAAAAAVGTLRQPFGPTSWLSRLAALRTALVVHDLSDDPTYQAYADLLGQGMTSSVVVAMDGRDGLVGALAALDPCPQHFEPTDVAFLQTVANVLVTAIERSRVTATMRHHALHDALTGLPNRTLLFDRLDVALRRLSRHGEDLILLFVDLDRFKRINDTLGHHVGDLVLVEAARRIKAAVRADDTVARLGGDEFIVLCETVADKDEATQVAERIGEHLARPMRIEDHDLVVTASLGIAVANADHGTPEDLLRDADLAMYLAKQRGRARQEVFDDRLRESVMDRLAIERSLRQAGAQGELVVAYQPQVDLRSGEVVGVEALVRWQHPVHGLVMPDRFIGVAEDLGLIGSIGSFVLKETCREAKALHRLGAELSVAVNLSSRQLSDPDLAPLVAGILTDCDLPPERLVIEVTEATLLADGRDSADVLADLRLQGVRVSIDDFGTGYSPLSYLTRMRVDEVKIDRSFTSGLGLDPSRTAIVSAVIAMGRALGLRVVAEGVERPEQLALLQDLGCDWGQGWLWSPGRPGPDLHRWLVTEGRDGTGLVTVPRPSRNGTAEPDAYDGDGAGAVPAPPALPS